MHGRWFTVSVEWYMHYHFYLNKPVTLDTFRGMFAELKGLRSNMEASIVAEDWIHIEVDLNPYWEEHGIMKTDRWYHGSKIEVGINARNNIFYWRDDMCDPVINNGERQLTMGLETQSPLCDTVSLVPEIGFDLQAVLIVLARHADPFFGFLLSENNLIFWVPIPPLHGFDFLQYLFTRDPSSWGSLYCDSALLDSIGAETLGGWVEQSTPVDDIGAFIEMNGPPLQQYGQKDDPLRKEKDDLFIQMMYPKIIDRLEKEYEIKAKKLGELVIDHYPYGPLEG